MTAREYAKSNGVEIVGKLTKVTKVNKSYDVITGDFIENKVTFYIDEIGNEFHKIGKNWVIITSDGGVI